MIRNATAGNRVVRCGVFCATDNFCSWKHSLFFVHRRRPRSILGWSHRYTRGFHQVGSASRRARKVAAQRGPSSVSVCTGGVQTRDLEATALLKRRWLLLMLLESHAKRQSGLILSPDLQEVSGSPAHLRDITRSGSL